MSRPLSASPATGAWCGVGLLIASLAFAPVALAQSPEEKVVQLNREAMEAYTNLDVNRAGSLLEEALRMAAQGNVSADVVARTHVNLGVVYVGGLGDNTNGMKYMTQALCIDPNVQLDPVTSSPDIKTVFQLAKQKAQGGACEGGAAPGAGGGGAAPAPQPGPPAGGGAAPAQKQGGLSHQPAPEQLVQTPLPVYAQVSGDPEHVYLYYKSLGMDTFKQVEMQPLADGFGYQIGCEDVWQPNVKYYMEAVGDDGEVIGSAGSQQSPIVVSIVSERSAQAPSLPGRPPPKSCAQAEECPPGMECEGAGGGSGGLGDTCVTNADCQSGMSCVDNFCSLEEGGVDEDEDDGEDGVPRFFARVGGTLGLPWVKEGMVADTPPPDESQLIAQEDIFPEEGGMISAGTWYNTTAWIPDANSRDANGNLYKPGECPADDTPTTANAMGSYPSRYCARVDTPGMVPHIAMRAAIGYWILPRLAAQAIMRFQFASGEGTLAGILLGARAEYLITAPVEEGFMLSVLAGYTFGQIQAKPPTNDGGPSPWVISGLSGVHAGTSLRYRFMRNFGIHLTPEVDVLFPEFLFNVDVTLGVETSF